MTRKPGALLEPLTTFRGGVQQGSAWLPASIRDTPASRSDLGRLRAGALQLENPIRILALAGAAICAIPPAWAEPTGDLQEVTVTARQLEETLPQNLAQFGARLDVTTRAQIVNGGYADVAESLMPAFYIQPQNGPVDYADIALLGSRNVDVLWLVDGMRINNRLYGTTLPIDTLPAAMIDRLEVLEEGRGALLRHSGARRSHQHRHPAVLGDPRGLPVDRR
jgi:hypothetical protein